jgi:hypothetical protein
VHHDRRQLPLHGDHGFHVYRIGAREPEGAAQIERADLHENHGLSVDVLFLRCQRSS